MPLTEFMRLHQERKRTAVVTNEEDPLHLMEVYLNDALEVLMDLQNIRSKIKAGAQPGVEPAASMYDLPKEGVQPSSPSPPSGTEVPLSGSYSSLRMSPPPGSRRQDTALHSPSLRSSRADRIDF